MNKVKVYHFHNGGGGGVLSVIRNLFRFANTVSIENHIIYTINKDQTPMYSVEHIAGAITEKVFYYSPKWNFYYTCSQLAKLLPDDKALVVAHDWLELGMMSNLGLQNPVVQVLHGDYDYYYELAKKHSDAVDAFICISPQIFRILKFRLPERQNDIFYFRFPVPSVKTVTTVKDSLHLIYCVRDLKDYRKQFSTILEIAEKIGYATCNYFFTIAGGGMTTKEFFELWPAVMINKVCFKGLLTNDEIIAILPLQDIFLLPSLVEGLPVSLVEAMKAGAVPLVTNWDGAVDELITPGISGYYFKIGASADYATCIKNLNDDRKLLSQLSTKCVERANQLFDPVNNTKDFENLYQKISKKEVVQKRRAKVYGSRLDHPAIPNFITSLIREK